MSDESCNEAVEFNSRRELTKTPESYATAGSLATALLSTGRLEDARTAYCQILGHDPTNLEAMIALGRIEKQLGDDAAACNYLDRAASADPYNLLVLTELAAVLRELNRTEEATSVYERILSRDGKHVPAHMGLAWIARAKDDHAAALEHFTIAAECLRSLAENDPNNLNTLVQLGAALHELDQQEPAAAVYRRVLAENPNHAHTHIGMGWIAHRAGDHETALAHFRAACKANPRDLQPQVSLAKALALMRRFEESQAIYQRVAKQAPNNWRVRAALGALARDRRDWSGALEHLSAAVAAEPQNVPFRMDLARTFCDLLRWEEAERIYRAILQDSPGNIEAMIGLAESAKARGDTQTAFSLFEAVAVAAPLDLRPKKEIRRLKVAQGGYDWKTEVEEAVAVVHSPSAPPQTRIEAAKILVEYGLTEVARPLLFQLEAAFPAARQLLLVVRQIERMGLAQPVSAPPEDSDRAENRLEALRGFIEMPMPNADTLLIVFGGTNNRVSITFSLLHKILRKMGVSIIYCRDIQEEWYTRGIVGLGNDFRSTVAGFEALATRYSTKRVLALGNCIGCLGALRYGLSLGAQGVLGLDPKLQQGATVKPDRATQLAVVRLQLPPGHKNVYTAYRDAVSRPTVSLIYGQHHTVDATGVHSLADVPGVAVTGIPDSADPVKDLLVRGLLEPLLKDFIDNGVVSSEIHALVSTSTNPQSSR